jgi:hypothetical protein
MIDPLSHHDVGGPGTALLMANMCQPAPTSDLHRGVLFARPSFIGAANDPVSVIDGKAAEARVNLVSTYHSLSVLLFPCVTTGKANRIGEIRVEEL